MISGTSLEIQKLTGIPKLVKYEKSMGRCPQYNLLKWLYVSSTCAPSSPVKPRRDGAPARRAAATRAARPLQGRRLGRAPLEALLAYPGLAFPGCSRNSAPRLGGCTGDPFPVNFDKLSENNNSRERVPSATSYDDPWQGNLLLGATLEGRSSFVFVSMVNPQLLKKI